MEENVKILLCEDDENLGMLLREYLQAKGFTTELCPDGEAGFRAFQRDKFDICVLDVMMPKKDGFTLASDIRQSNLEIPIIFLTAKQLKEDILEGFKIGADDYITKPFSMEELVFRIEAILRRVRGKKTKESTVYQLGRFVFDTQKQLLTNGDKMVKLTTKENELLSLLCSHANGQDHRYGQSEQSETKISRASSDVATPIDDMVVRKDSSNTVLNAERLGSEQRKQNEHRKEYECKADDDACWHALGFELSDERARNDDKQNGQ